MFISADMEGCAGVSAFHALIPGQWEWPAARQWMTNEVVAVANAAFEQNYDEVIVADSHGNGHNIDPDLLPDNVRLVRSWPRPLLHMQGIEDPAVEACAFVGYHAGTASTEGLLAHAYHGGVFRSISVNGELCSEGYLNAALAGEFKIPVVFVSGDRATVEDAQRYAPGAMLFQTKEAIGWKSQSSLPPGQVCRLLKGAGAAAFAAIKAVPFRISPPLEADIVLTSHVTTELLDYLPCVQRTGGTSVSATFASITELMRFIAFVMLYSPTGNTSL
jgi:D-amino peptidase